MTRKRLSGSPIKAKKDELAKQEADLRRQMEDLEQIIAEAPKIAEAELERKRQEQIARASTRRATPTATSSPRSSSCPSPWCRTS